jgi:hypothetical protein
MENEEENTTSIGSSGHAIATHREPKGKNSINPALIDAATLQRQKMIPIDVEEAQLLNS